jgi:exodeoxyribonuclease VII small subunit
MAHEKQFTFEKGMERLEEIASLLDRGQVPLEEAITLYEEGQKTAKKLQEVLNRAERAVSLAPVDQGKPNDEAMLVQTPALEPKRRKPGEEPSLF